MLQNNIINNINIDSLPDHVQQAILIEFNNLSLQDKLIINAKFVHGNLFKSDRKDIFGIHRVTINKIYDQFITKLQNRLVGQNEPT
jgi:hypothetical protein